MQLNHISLVLIRNIKWFF